VGRHCDAAFCSSAKRCQTSAILIRAAILGSESSAPLASIPAQDIDTLLLYSSRACPVVRMTNPAAKALVPTK
jgi:hypothetical protein